jgi:predicted enzyme related to lactoylglutathione lyase
MAKNEKRQPGYITWMDLTVSNAEVVRDFYQQVVGWTPEPVKMGDYSDFTMKTVVDDQPVAGICHARGANSNLPPSWLIYINVEDLAESIKRCNALGGKIISEPRTISGYGRFCVIEDPAGAVAALFEPED